MNTKSKGIVKDWDKKFKKIKLSTTPLISHDYCDKEIRQNVCLQCGAKGHSTCTRD
jgi:hypothetical protein